MAPIETPRQSDIWLKGKPSPHLNNFRKSGIDPCRILEPKRKTLQSLEAERIMTVFRDTVGRMEITLALPYILYSLPRFSVIFGRDLTSRLSNHSQLQHAYKKALAELGGISRQNVELQTGRETNTETEVGSGNVKLNHNPSIIVAPANGNQLRIVFNCKKEVEFLEKRIKCSLREILRFFKKNPKAIEMVTESKPVRNEEYTALLNKLTSVESIMKERLLTSPFEEQDMKLQLTEIIEREKKTTALREKLETNYQAAVEAKESEIYERDITILRLQQDLQLIEKIHSEQQQRTLIEALKQSSQESNTSKAKIANYCEEISLCRKKIQEDKKEHRENETLLRKRRFKMATEVFNWVQKYDADLSGRQDEYDLYTRMYDADKEQLRQLQERFSILEKQYDAIIEERRVAEEEKVREMEEERKQNQAANVIQTIWRYYQFRILMRSKSKKSSRKGKGGK